MLSQFFRRTHVETCQKILKPQFIAVRSCSNEIKYRIPIHTNDKIRQRTANLEGRKINYNTVTYNQKIKLLPPEIEYKFGDDNFLTPEIEDDPYVRLSDDEIVALGDVEFKNVCDWRMPLTEVDPNKEPFSHAFEGNEDHDHFTKVSVINDPTLWYWVERLLPKRVIPMPNHEPGEVQPSGFVTPQMPDKNPDLTYFVQRTRGHMYPVYRKTEKDKKSAALQTVTEICLVDGDLWQLEEDLRSYLEEKHKKKILSACDEWSGSVKFKGDYVFESVEWLAEQGF